MVHIDPPASVCAIMRRAMLRPRREPWTRQGQRDESLTTRAGVREQPSKSATLAQQGDVSDQVWSATSKASRSTPLEPRLGSRAEGPLRPELARLGRPQSDNNASAFEYRAARTSSRRDLLMTARCSDLVGASSSRLMIAAGFAFRLAA